MPIPDLANGDQAEIELKIGDGKITYQFRLAPFKWSTDDEINCADNIEAVRIDRLRKAIAEYDRDWELISIYPPGKGSDTVHVLYRKKLK